MRIYLERKGSQFTSKEFTMYCESQNAMQSMSKARCLYDNAPMERYFGTTMCDHIPIMDIKHRLKQDMEKKNN